MHFVSLEVEEHSFARFNGKKIAMNDVLAPNYLLEGCSLRKLGFLSH